MMKSITDSAHATVQRLHRLYCFPAFVLVVILVLGISGLGAEEFYVDVNSSNPNQSGSITEPFHSINAAVLYIYNGHTPLDNVADILILPGTYVENITIRFSYYTSTITLWNFQAYTGGVTIIGYTLGDPIFSVESMMGSSVTFQDLDFATTSLQVNKAFSVTAPNIIGTLKFSNCSFSGFKHSILITEVQDSEEIMNVSNFEVADCYFEGIHEGGVGIYTYARSDELYGGDYPFVPNISIHNNTFSDNGITQPAQYYSYECITIRNWRKVAPAYEQVHIFENSFEGSTANVYPFGVILDRLNRQYNWFSQIACKAFVYDNVFMNHRVLADISKLKFTDNQAEITQTAPLSFLTFQYLSTESETHADTLWTERNIVHAPHAYSLSHAILKDKQNSFFGSEKFINANDSHASIENSLVNGYSQYFGLTGLSAVNTTHSYYDVLENNNLVTYENCLSQVDPLISHHSTGLGYSLLWNNDNRSPLIMAGIGTTGAMGQSTRNDRLDIGAVQYDEYPHEYITYTFPSYSQRNGLKWMSFPSLDRIWNPTTDDPDVAQVFFEPIIDEDILDQIAWKVLDDAAEDIHFVTGQGWQGDMYHNIIPQQGYKIQMAQGLQDPQNIAVPGVIPIVSQNPLSIKAASASKAVDIGNENWLGYFHETTVEAADAFEGIIDNLWSIQTQNWTMVREDMVPGSPWIYALQHGKDPVLSYGDMVIVKCFEDAQFYWNTAALEQIPLEKELPDHFDFEEKPDYIPFYVELDANDLPREIALYVDDVCKGAAVVNDSFVEIPGYIVDNPDPNAEVEIRALYESKAAVHLIPEFRVWNQTQGIYERKPIILNSKDYYYKLRLASSEEDSPVTPEPGLQVYPNPFNPSTTIKFSLPASGEIQLDIYNLKGQLVCNLAKGELMSGKHSIVWDGTDNQHKKVSSGLYYSKLSYQNTSFVKKMVMLK